MNFISVMNQLKVIAETKGTNAKIEKLKHVDQNAIDVLTIMYDPFHVIGFRKVPDFFVYTETNDFSDDFIFEKLIDKDSAWFRNHIGSVSKTQNEFLKLFFSGFQAYKMGISGSSFLKVFPDAYQTFTLQLAGKYSENHVKFPCYVQPKYDGVRCVVIVDYKGNVECLSRNGKTLYNIDEEILDRLSKHTNCVFDGEAITDNDFNLSVGLIHRHNSDQKSGLVLFDLITTDELQSKICEWTYEDRVDMFPKDLQDLYAKHEVVNSHEEILDKYKEYIDLGYEGCIVKSSDGLYSFKRTRDWMKVKPEVEDTFEITEVHEGRGKYQGTFGAVTVITEKGPVKGQANVGTGFSDDQRKELWDRRDELVGMKMEVQFMEYTPDGSLRHPRFIKIREDI